MENSLLDLRPLAWSAAAGIGVLASSLTLLIGTALGQRILARRSGRILLWLSASELFSMLCLGVGFGVAVFVRSGDHTLSEFLHHPEAQQFLLAWSSFWTPALLVHVLLTLLCWLVSTRFFPTIEKKWREVIPALFCMCFLLFPIAVGVVTHFLSYTGMLNWYASALDYAINLIVVSLASAMALLAPRLSIRALQPGAFTWR